MTLPLPLPYFTCRIPCFPVMEYSDAVFIGTDLLWEFLSDYRFLRFVLQLQTLQLRNITTVPFTVHFTFYNLLSFLYLSFHLDFSYPT
jgi:hypothetical protein